MKGRRTIPAEQDPRFEALLTAAAQGLALEQEREADRLFEQLGREPEIESSPEHLADMQSLLQKAKHSKRHSGRGRFLLQWAACLALAACVGSVAFPTQAAAVWQQLRSFVYRQYVTHTEIHISAPESEINTGPTADEFAPVRPSYIPEGFVCTEEEQLTILSFMVYERNEQRISFQQMFADGTGIGLDTEDAYTENTQVSGMEALYVEKQIEDSVHRTLLYHDEVYIYLLSADGLSRQELFKIAESVPAV